eukprot:5396844-Prymnesium_polylepis.1
MAADRGAGGGLHATLATLPRSQRILPGHFQVGAVRRRADAGRAAGTHPHLRGSPRHGTGADPHQVWTQRGLPL